MSSPTPDRKPKPTSPPTHLPPLIRKGPRPAITPTPGIKPAEPPVEQTMPALPPVLRAKGHALTAPNVDVPTPPPLPAMFSEPPATLEPPPLPVPPPLPPLSELQPWSGFSVGPGHSKPPTAPPPAADSEFDLSLEELKLAPP